MNGAQKKKIKLCIVTPTHWSAFMGGAQYQVKCIIEQLLQTERYEIEYLADLTEPSYVPKEYVIRPIEGRTSRLGRIAHANKLYRLLEAYQPEVIYQRVACSYSGIAALYAKRNNVKMIWHVAHDGDVSPGAIKYGGNLLRQRLESASVAYAIKHATSIVTQTQHQANLLLAHHRRKANAIMPNFHPVPSARSPKKENFTVLWVANFKSWKNPEAFINLAERFQDQNDVEFLMAGAEPKGAKEGKWFQALTERTRHIKNLRYIGQQTQEAINDLLASAHVFVNTSWQEGFANTFIQAWLREVPVISLYVNPDGVFDNEEIGFYAGSEDRGAELLNLLIENPGLRSEMGRKAEIYARTNHSSKNVQVLRRLFEA